MPNQTKYEMPVLLFPLVDVLTKIVCSCQALKIQCIFFCTLKFFIDSFLPPHPSARTPSFNPWLKTAANKCAVHLHKQTNKVIVKAFTKQFFTRSNVEQSCLTLVLSKLNELITEKI